MLLVTDGGLTLRWSRDRDGSVWLQCDDGPKFPALSLDSALGVCTSDIIAALLGVEHLDRADASSRSLVGRVAADDIVDEETGEILVEAGMAIAEHAGLHRAAEPIALVVTEHSSRAQCFGATRAQANRDWLIDPFGAALVGLEPSTADAIRSGKVPIGARCAAALDELVAERERESTTLTSADLVYIWLQFAG